VIVAPVCLDASDGGIAARREAVVEDVAVEGFPTDTDHLAVRPAFGTIFEGAGVVIGARQMEDDMLADSVRALVLRARLVVIAVDRPEDAESARRIARVGRAGVAVGAGLRIPGNAGDGPGGGRRAAIGDRAGVAGIALRSRWQRETDAVSGRIARVGGRARLLVVAGGSDWQESRLARPVDAILDLTVSGVGVARPGPRLMDATRRRIAGVRRARVTVVAGDGLVAADPRGRIATVDGAGVSVVARRAVEGRGRHPRGGQTNEEAEDDGRARPEQSHAAHVASSRLSRPQLSSYPGENEVAGNIPSRPARSTSYCAARSGSSRGGRGDTLPTARRNHSLWTSTISVNRALGFCVVMDTC